MMERDWKEAKPKWVVEAAQAEMATLTRRLALHWPDEAAARLERAWSALHKDRGFV